MNLDEEEDNWDSLVIPNEGLQLPPTLKPASLDPGDLTCEDITFFDIDDDDLAFSDKTLPTQPSSKTIFNNDTPLSLEHLNLSAPDLPTQMHSQAMNSRSLNSSFDSDSNAFDGPNGGFFKSASLLPAGLSSSRSHDDLCSGSPISYHHIASVTRHVPGLRNIQPSTEYPSSDTDSAVLSTGKLSRSSSTYTGFDGVDENKEDDLSDSLTYSNSNTLPPSGLHPALFQLSKRFQSSPTPSSNASVIASEGDDERFDDLEFPETISGLKFHQQSQQETDDPLGGFGNSKNSFVLSNSHDDDNDELGFSIPEDFSWNKANLEARVTSTMSGQKSATPSKIPVIRPSIQHLRSLPQNSIDFDDNSLSVHNTVSLVSHHEITIPSLAGKNYTAKNRKFSY
jgi:hypothetical protein